jgi:hypothetical protein
MLLVSSALLGRGGHSAQEDPELSRVAAQGIGEHIGITQMQVSRILQSILADGARTGATLRDCTCPGAGRLNDRVGRRVRG